jgi:hypothetical protein
LNSKMIASAMLVPPFPDRLRTRLMPEAPYASQLGQT